MDKILIVEDEKNIVLTLKMYLKKLGYEIQVASNGTEAVEIAQESIPNLILLDILLPKMNGYLVLEALKEKDDTKEIPIIMISAKNQEEDINKAFSLGVDDYIIKPFTYKQIKNVVRKYLK